MALIVGLVLTPLLGVVGLAPARAAAGDRRLPLDVRLTSIAPATLPAHGRVRLRGTVTNRSHQLWRHVNVQTVTSQVPITDPATLAEAAATEPDTTFGARLTAPNTFAQVGDIRPGQTIAFDIRVPRRLLNITGAPGVYWIGVHALGTANGTRDQVADGRARTFIPLLAPRHVPGRTGVSLVLPVRAHLGRSADGTVAHPRRLARSMSPDGRLGRIEALGRRAGPLPVTWLVDPALLDTADALAHGRPGLDVGRAPAPGQPTSSPSPSAQAAPRAVLDNQDQADARHWLTRMTSLMSSSSPLALPYGDPDVSALVRTDGSLLRRAMDLSDTALRHQGLTAGTAVAPPDGYLAPKVFDHLTPNTTALLTDHRRRRHAAVSLADGTRVVYADTGASSGGPRPEPRFAALTLRQRILSEAALRALAGGHQRLVVELPRNWDPGAQWQRAGFFTGLEQPWLRLRPLPQAHTVTRHPPPYPPRARRHEVPALNIHVAARLTRIAQTFGSLLDVGHGGDAGVAAGVDQDLTGTALDSVSYGARSQPVVARNNARSIVDSMQRLLSSVKLDGTEFVTLSSDSGTLTLSLANGLDQPIRVGLHAISDGPGVRIDNLKPMQMAAGQRTTVRLQAHASKIGVHEVAVVPMTGQHRRFGTGFSFTLRTSQVGRWFWVILLVVGALLVLLILRRIVVRVQTHRWHP